jgi:hypothetical protein
VRAAANVLKLPAPTAVSTISAARPTDIEPIKQQAIATMAEKRDIFIGEFLS